MKSQIPELREPSCCCVGVRKVAFMLALGQAVVLFLCVALCAVGYVRYPNMSNDFGYYVSNGEVSVLAVSFRDGPYEETLQLEFHADVEPRQAILMSDVQVAEVKVEATMQEDGQLVISESVQPVDNLQVSIIGDYQVDPVSPCKARRNSLLILGSVGLAFGLTVLALVGVLRVRPSYLVPYCFMHFCDMVLTAGALLTAFTHVRMAREWILSQRYVEMDMELTDRLLRLSDAELHAILVLAGAIVFFFKALWFYVVCRCYSFLVGLRHRRTRTFPLPC